MQEGKKTKLEEEKKNTDNNKNDSPVEEDNAALSGLLGGYGSDSS
jgi:hypothetical protein